MKLDRFLVLNQYFHNLFGASSLADLKQTLKRTQEGQAGDGQSFFYASLVGQVRDPVLRVRLCDYDARVMGYESRLARARGAFTFKYFQYLCLLYAEIYLDRLTDDPQKLLLDLNRFLQNLKSKENHDDGVFVNAHKTRTDPRRGRYAMECA
jgi:hypothetical protein